MTERTVIVIMQVTKVFKDIPEEHTLNKEAITLDAKDVKKALKADDVVVTNIQEFVREEPEWHQG